MYTLRYKTHFDAAHHLEDYMGKCANVHGHRWEVEIEIKTKEKTLDMIVDFSTLKCIVDELDHTELNNVLNFNPTCENITKYLYDEILKQTGFKSTVTVWESPNSSITYHD